MVGITMIPDLGDWSKYLNHPSEQPYFTRLIDFLKTRNKEGAIIYPAKDSWFKAFELTQFKNTKVIILGQDPYHNPHQAQGLSFSVANGTTLPPSLKNIYKELELDLGIKPSANGDLTHWANQGVLLLNSVLTVEKNSPGSHVNIGWEEFTSVTIDALNENKQNLVFLLWGAYAQKKAEFIDKSKHLVLTAPHPSPFSAHKGFFGSKHFSKTNEYLKTHNLKPINW